MPAKSSRRQGETDARRDVRCDPHTRGRKAGLELGASIPACVRQRPQIPAVQLKDVECVEVRYPMAVHQRLELTLSALIETDNLAIENRTL